MSRWWLLAIPLCGCALEYGVYRKHAEDLATLRTAHVHESEARTGSVATRIEGVFSQLYCGLRTMARLPGVRKIGPHGEGFDADARASIQELYNNLASSVAMSEVYIVPRELDPDALDPATGAPWEPIAAFDELIVGRNGGAEDEGHEEAGLEEIEIHEYRLMREQLAWLAENAGQEGGIEDFEIPALGGREVVTCDNSRYSPSAPDDADRSGLVYSVPFYGPEGELKGLVSGVILTHALRDLLPDGGYALRQIEGVHRIGHDGEGQAQGSLAAVEAALPDPDLIYSSVVALDVHDACGPWLLWAGRPDADFLERPDVRASRVAALAMGAAVLVLTLLVLVAALAALGSRRRAALQQSQLECRVQEATGQVKQAVAALAASARDLDGAAHELSTTNHRMEADARSASSEAEGAARSAEAVRGSVEGVAASILQLGSSAREIEAIVGAATATAEEAARQADSAAAAIRELRADSDHIQGVSELISSIARHTNLLALNATIEAARAGAAGQGFGVVAHEVKELALRTAAATSEIARDIGGMRTRTATAVATIESMREAVAGICERQASVSSAIAQQNAATGAIEQSIEEASTETRAIAQRIDTVARTSAGTRTTVVDERQAIEQLAHRASELNRVIQQLGQP